MCSCYWTPQSQNYPKPPLLTKDPSLILPAGILHSEPVHFRISPTTLSTQGLPPTHSLHLLDCGAVRRVKEFLLIAFDWQSALSSFARSLEWGKPSMHWSTYRLMAGIWTALMDGDTGRPALRGADISEMQNFGSGVQLMLRWAKSMATCLHCKGGRDSPQDKETADLCETYRIWMWCSRDRR